MSQKRLENTVQTLSLIQISIDAHQSSINSNKIEINRSK